MEKQLRLSYPKHSANQPPRASVRFSQEPWASARFQNTTVFSRTFLSTVDLARLHVQRVQDSFAGLGTVKDVKVDSWHSLIDQSTALPDGVVDSDFELSLFVILNSF